MDSHGERCFGKIGSGISLELIPYTLVVIIPVLQPLPVVKAQYPYQ
jgi:hypothetical protein